MNAVLVKVSVVDFKLTEVLSRVCVCNLRRLAHHVAQLASLLERRRLILVSQRLYIKRGATLTRPRQSHNDAGRCSLVHHVTFIQREANVLLQVVCGDLNVSLTAVRLFRLYELVRSLAMNLLNLLFEVADATLAAVVVNQRHHGVFCECDLILLQSGCFASVRNQVPFRNGNLLLRNVTG